MVPRPHRSLKDALYTHKSHRGPSRGVPLCASYLGNVTQASGEITAEKWSSRDQGKPCVPANSAMITWPIFLVLMEIDAENGDPLSTQPCFFSRGTEKEATENASVGKPSSLPTVPQSIDMDVPGINRERLCSASSQLPSRLASREVAWPLSCSP